MTSKYLSEGTSSSEVLLRTGMGSNEVKVEDLRVMIISLLIFELMFRRWKIIRMIKVRCQTELNQRWKLSIRDVREGCHLHRGLV